MGVEVSLAANGQEALDLLQAAPDPLPWAMVLMDLQMPVMDGHQATIALRKMPRFKLLPIVAMTAHAMAEEGARCLAEGMNEHLTKPINPDALHRSLLRWSGISTAPAPSTQAIESLNIPGIDLAQGLRNCSGNRQLYESLLRKFMAAMVGTPQVVRDALGADDLRTAHRAIHTLKGVAANIGALHCRQLSVDVEQAFKVSSTLAHLQPHLRALELHLADLGEGLARALPLAPAPQIGATAQVTMEEFPELCKTLVILLTASDASSELFVQKNAGVLERGLGAHFEVVQRQVQNFEYELALDALQQAALAAQMPD
jgi:two-component system sensor histidine kinase/response regulator